MEKKKYLTETFFQFTYIKTIAISTKENCANFCNVLGRDKGGTGHGSTGEKNRLSGLWKQQATVKTREESTKGRVKKGMKNIQKAFLGNYCTVIALTEKEQISAGTVLPLIW